MSPRTFDADLHRSRNDPRDANGTLEIEIPSKLVAGENVVCVDILFYWFFELLNLMHLWECSRIYSRNIYSVYSFLALISKGLGR